MTGLLSRGIQPVQRLVRERRVRRIVRAAEELVAGGKPGDAAAALRAGLAPDAREARLLLPLARLELEAGHPAEAKRLCGRVRPTDPARVQAIALAKVSTQIEKSDKLRAQALADGRRSAELRRSARKLIATKQYTLALLLLREALELRPGALQTELALARLLDRMGDPAAALRHWRTIHRRRPKDTAAIQRLTGYADAGRSVSLPDDWMQFAAAATPEEIASLADDLFGLGDERSQVLLADACTAAKAGRADLAGVCGYLEARLNLSQGAFSAALALASSALDEPAPSTPEGDPLQRKLLRVLTVCLTRLGRYDEAFAALDRADLDAGDRLRMRVGVAWRKDPARALALLADVPAGEKSGLAPALISGIALLNGDTGLAARSFAEDQFDRLARHPVPDLLVSGAAVAHAQGDGARHGLLLRRYFEHFGLDFPLPPAKQPFAFTGLGFAPKRRKPGGPLVSVIMTAFNAEQTVRYAAGSVLDQTHRNLELIIVDDASDDGTGAILAEIAAADPRVRILRQPVTSGTYVAKNAALSVAGGAFVTFHDADDWCHPDRLERHVACMEANPTLAASRSKWIRLTRSGSPILRWTGTYTQNNPCSLFCRRNVLDEVGYFDRVKISADAEYLSRVLLRFGLDRVATLPLPLVIGLSHEASLTRSGVGGQDVEGYSAVRERYRDDALRWHRRQGPDGDLYLPAMPAVRPFETDPGITVAVSGTG